MLLTGSTQDWPESDMGAFYSLVPPFSLCVCERSAQARQLDGSIYKSGTTEMLLEDTEPPCVNSDLGAQRPLQPAMSVKTNSSQGN